MHTPKTYLIDDDDAVRDSLSLLLETADIPCHTYASAQDFLAVFDADMHGCLLLDVRMPAMSGLELQTLLNRIGCSLPIVFITGHGDVPTAVDAMKKGAVNFLLKPFSKQDLLESISAAFDISYRHYLARNETALLQDRLAKLTLREREILESVLQGQSAKCIARQFGISPRTVEWHRTQILKKLGYPSLLQLLASPINQVLKHVEPSPADGVS